MQLAQHRGCVLLGGSFGAGGFLSTMVAYICSLT